MYTGSSTILLVDDNNNEVFLIERAFRKANIANQLKVVGDGEAAIHYLLGKGDYSDRHVYPFPMLMLLDLKLPRKSGLEVLEWLRQQPGIKRLPVIALTSSKQSADINRAYELGINSYLVKPITFDRLVEVIQAFDNYWTTISERPDLQESDF
ncbi:response regulator [Anabaena lutea]|uniref:Response regulator n=1 Tax=Anabaena lutea FACHB-196 TaxID=2692881 RepID=A0ABR8FA63_9NOST|nr:response regulator [Anabaena lutea]MBD2567093.1 response regulator [Anabaena lutea FACHB-196]